jgi:hypothetical protein
MDHAEAREILELAAVEPAGLDRLVAGDTAQAAVLASHLAGCPECTAEMARLRRVSTVIRDVIRTTPPPELRARTLAFVAAIGRDRGVAGAGPADEGSKPGVAGHEPRPITSASSVRRVGATRALWVATLAAAIVVSVAATGLLVSQQLELRTAERDQAIAGLSRVAAWSVRVSGEPDVERVALAATGAEDASGTLLYSATSRELVVVASGLREPVTGYEFRCWVEIDGRRTDIGRMFFGGELSYWAGDVAALDPEAGATFGVSIVSTANPDDLSADPVISGEM